MNGLLLIFFPQLQEKGVGDFLSEFLLNEEWEG